MSEFKFSCPACSQNISCDTASVGTQIACPNCNATITVPKETAGTAQRTSGLAIASLVCSLSSFITCVGWLPGIICGHLAKSRLRRNPSLKGSGLATAGLVIGYLFLMSEVGTTAVYVWRVSNAVKHGFENARQNLATNKIIVVQTQSITVSNKSQPPEPALFHPPPHARNRCRHQPANRTRQIRMDSRYQQGFVPRPSGQREPSWN